MYINIHIIIYIYVCARVYIYTYNYIYIYIFAFFGVYQFTKQLPRIVFSQCINNVKIFPGILDM
jgi:hypothetical protein